MTVVLKEVGFVIFETDTETLVEEDTSKKYLEVERVVLEAKPQHISLYCKEESRFRLITSYTQALTNELVLRSPRSELPVEFAPNLTQFDYGCSSISYSFQEGKLVSQGIDSTALLSNNASKEVREALALQDMHLDNVQRGLNVVQGIAVAINEELESSKFHLEDTAERVERNHEKLSRQHHRMKNMVDS